MSVLGVVGIADKGVYSATATYKKMNFVLYNGSTWLALNDNLTGVTPEEGENWKYLARGWAAELLSMISATDTSGLLGTAGETVNGQTLIDKIADMVADKLILKTAISNQQINDTSKITGSALSYAMNQSIVDLNSNFANYYTKTQADNVVTGNITYSGVTNVSLTNRVNGKHGVIAGLIKNNVEIGAATVVLASLQNYGPEVDTYFVYYLDAGGASWGYLATDGKMYFNIQSTIAANTYFRINISYITHQ